MPDDDLDQQHGIYGDDWADLIIAYAEKFGVDVSTCHAGYHTRPEGLSINGLINYKPRKDNYIPITPRQLLAFAHSGKWEIEYPEIHPLLQYDHERSKKISRLNYVLLAILLAILFFIGYQIQ